MEALALVGRGRPEDLERGVNLCEFAIQAEFSDLHAAGNQLEKMMDQTLFIHVQMVGYYKVGEFTKAIESCQHVLTAMIPDLSIPRQALLGFFQIQLFSYLHQGKMGDALTVVSQMEATTGLPAAAAATARRILERNEANPRQALTMLEGIWPTDAWGLGAPRN
jgi:hypothetical protein